MDVARIPVIAGPTGAGKSAVALALAARRPVTIVSADSRQIYRGFDVGTAKPSAEEQRAAPHALIDIVDPSERYSAARWADAASDAITEALSAGRLPVIVGGTGLYLRALFQPLFVEPELDTASRAHLERELAAVPTEALREEVLGADPARAHLGRTQLLRAIEVHRLTGRPLSEWHEAAPRAAQFRPTWLLVARSATLAQRIEHRLDDMLQRGWLDEVAALDARVPGDAPAWKACGYAHLREVSRGARQLADARQEMLYSTRQFAKRQRTWFRHQIPATEPSVIADLDAAGWASTVDAWWREVSP